MSDGGVGRSRVLFVCTANQARSPLAETIARDLIGRRALTVDVASAGFLPGGARAAEDGRRVAAERGLDLSSHVSRQLDDGLIAAADLIVAMTGDHVLDLVSGWPDAAHRTVLLRLVAEAHGPGSADGRTVRAWAATVVPSGRTAVLDGRLDVADPMGRGLRAFRRTGAELEAMLSRMFDGWPTGDVSSAS